MMSALSQPHKGTMLYVSRVAGLLLLLALACVFFYSAYSKSGVQFQHWWLVPDDNAFDNFQWTLLDLGINNVMVAGILARVFIGFELMLGIFLVAHVALRRFTYPAIIALLTIFIIYLIMVLVKQGNTGNCGCFGNNVSMKPMAAIWKNVIMIVATLVLHIIYPGRTYKGQELVAVCAGMFAIAMPFIVNVPNNSAAPTAYKKAIDLSPLYAQSPAPNVDLRHGKHIVSFMSLYCQHCKKAAYLQQIIYKSHPGIPMYFVLNGHESQLKQFFEETHAEQVPHLFFTNTDAFLGMAGSSVPSIYWINNGVIEYASTYYQLDPAQMEKWASGR
jgi:hypothetical protein